MASDISEIIRVNNSLPMVVEIRGVRDGAKGVSLISLEKPDMPPAPTMTKGDEKTKYKMTEKRPLN